MRNRKWILHGLVSVLVLSGCGGGGSGSGSASLDRITPVVGAAADLSNTDTAAKVAGDMATMPGSIVGMLTSTSVVTSAAQAAEPALPRGISTTELGTQLLKIALRPKNSARAMAAVTESENCDNAGTAISEVNVQNDFAINAGDRITVSARDCRMAMSPVESIWLHGDFRLEVLTGNNINPDGDLSGLTLRIEMTPLSIKTIHGSETALDVALDGGFVIAFSRDVISGDMVSRITSSGEAGTLTERLTQAGLEYKTTLTAFDIQIRPAAGLNQLDINGQATVSTNRIRSSPATRYTWRTSSWITLEPATQAIYSGSIALSSTANSTQIQLEFGQICNNTNSCVRVSTSTGDGVFTPMNTYSWSEYVALNP